MQILSKILIKEFKNKEIFRFSSQFFHVLFFLQSHRFFSRAQLLTTVSLKTPTRF